MLEILAGYTHPGQVSGKVGSYSRKASLRWEGVASCQSIWLENNSPCRNGWFKLLISSYVCSVSLRRAISQQLIPFHISAGVWCEHVTSIKYYLSTCSWMTTTVGTAGVLLIVLKAAKVASLRLTWLGSHYYCILNWDKGQTKEYRAVVWDGSFSIAIIARILDAMDQVFLFGLLVNLGFPQLGCVFPHISPEAGRSFPFSHCRQQLHLSLSWPKCF